MSKHREIIPYEDIAFDTVTYVINRAMYKVGNRLTLTEIAKKRREVCPKALVKTRHKIRPPIAINAEKFIRNVIEKEWGLTNVFQYCIKYKNCSSDETSKYYYFEAIFSQPTIEYPIPQTTASVFFTIKDRLLERHEAKEETTPIVTFRLEGHHSDQDVRYVKLHHDRLLGILMMKLKLFQKMERLGKF